MSWLTNKLAQAVAGKELEQLHRIKTDLQMYRRWLAEFPEIALLLDTIAANHSLPGCYDQVNCQDVMRLREQMRGLAKPCASQIANSEAQAGLYRNGEAHEIRASLAVMKARGMEVIPSAGCDNQDAKGYCLGHEENDPQAPLSAGLSHGADHGEH